MMLGVMGDLLLQSEMIMVTVLGSFFMSWSVYSFWRFALGLVKSARRTFGVASRH
jgi:hypothetical protein